LGFHGFMTNAIDFYPVWPMCSMFK